MASDLSGSWPDIDRTARETITRVPVFGLNSARPSVSGLHAGGSDGTRHLMVVRDGAMAAVVRRAEQIAGSDAAVLIVGESGTGKEILARHIHARSRRAGGPFVAVNCAAIPDQLLESELFGYEKGAFSGAVGRRIGKFEAANGGTILLDEISELDLRLQAKLLRVLQEREVDRLGGRAPVKIDVRVIATTNRDPRGEVERNQFRHDLFFRLNVVRMAIPPLRQRPEDITVLMDHFARKYATLNDLPPPSFSTAARSRLLSYAWPGNVRELENIVHGAVVLAGGGLIDAAVLELPDQEAGMTPRPAPAAATARSFVAQSLGDMERDLILRTLAHTSGNRTHAAAMLGISIRALRNKLRDYAASGITVPRPSKSPAP
ncbi:sigma-54 interaction domain-containing protein [Rhodopila sp.]|jgi:DNA-binding NtrC family response regulator|uniref:sigma-54 interaction domain-containing protein n=1 Tax=Rhodopila sp. TaxID=2480087 RepID=UPI002C32C5D7|nr:sigma-54 dependent transcriptional regulator [Rhodopila sp.]HVZ08661.1 sigma-54 dependent transcriptional regulator [Rhodopila sp.]